MYHCEGAKLSSCSCMQVELDHWIGVGWFSSQVGLGSAIMFLLNSQAHQGATASDAGSSYKIGQTSIQGPTTFILQAEVKLLPLSPWGHHLPGSPD